VTEEEAKEFAEKLSQAVKGNDPARVDSLLHLNDLVERLVSDLNLSAVERRNFMAGAQRSLQQGGFGRQILRSIGDGGSYKLLRVHTGHGRPRALFRMISGEGAVNYHDYVLARFPDSTVGMEDVYVFITAEPLSQTMRRILIPVLTQTRGGGKAADDLTKAGPDFVAMTQAVQQGQLAQAVAKYRQLPQALQDNKAVLVIYLQVLVQQAGAGEKDYLAAMEKFRKLYPDDAAVDFVSIDYYLIKKQYDDALKAIAAVQKAVGGDAHLESMRANVLAEAGRYDEARAAAEKAVKDEPDLDSGYWSRITVSLREKKYADTVEWLKKVVEQCKIEVQDLTQNPEFAGFIKSPQHGEWRKWYRAHSKK
jgi:tetratricopeptide (TPR) repeat protein